MGYDMHWRKLGDTEETDVVAARAVWDAALAARDALPREEAGQFNVAKAKETGDWDAHEVYDGRTERYRSAQDAVMAASAAQDGARVSYFRLNITGMGLWYTAMRELGMVFDGPDHPPFPDVEEYGVNHDDVERVEHPEHFTDAPPVDEETREKALRYIAAVDEVLTWHGAEIPGIPAHKFSSNDGWIVLPAECDAALRIYTAKLNEVGQDSMHNLIDNLIGPGARGRWGQWLAYLNGAITHDGFTVD